MGRVVAGTAGHSGMLAVECISRLRVVEPLWRRIPVHHREIRPIVIRMAFYASRTLRPRARIRGVKSLVLLQLIGNLLMTFDASKRWRLRRDFMAFYAIGRSVQALVRLGKRTRRNLRICHPG